MVSIFNEDFMRMVELSRQGFFCSQILLIMGLEKQGKENPDLIRAMNGLIGGLVFGGKLCGSLSGGACLLTLYAGKGTAEEISNPRLELMVNQLVEWFEEQYGAQYGGIDCDDILENNPQNRPHRCPQIVRETYSKVLELLTENGFDLDG